MARLLLFAFPADHSTGSTAAAAAPLVQLLLVALVVAAVVVSLCTSSTHAKLWKQRGATTAPVVKTDGGGTSVSRKQLLAASLSGIGGKAAAMAKMVSWNRRSPAPGSSDDEEVGVEDEEEAVWRKAIIMGEKCQPLQFSGHITFDTDGKQLPPATSPPRINIVDI